MKRIALAALAAVLALGTTLVVRTVRVRRDAEGRAWAGNVFRDFRMGPAEAWASRNGSGTFSLYTPGNPVTTATTIGSAWANNTLSDLATEITDSLSRSGKGGMLAAVRGINGTVSSPAYSWTGETNTGPYRNAAGDIRLSLLGSDAMKWTSTGVTVYGAGSLVGNVDIGTAAQGTAAQRKALTFNAGGFAAPGAAFADSNGDKLILYNNSADALDARIGIGTASDLWYKASNSGGTAIHRFYTGATPTERLRISDSAVNVNSSASLTFDSGTITGGSASTGVTFSNAGTGAGPTNFLLNSTASRSSGQLLLDVQNNGTSRLKMDGAGLVTFGGSSGAAQVTIDSSNNGNIQTAAGGTITTGFLYVSGTNATLTIAATTFANIGTPSNGTFRYCSDCTIANPCAGSGTGAFAKRLNGAWVCN